MKAKKGYMLKEVAGTYVIVPVTDLDFDGIITLNGTGTLIWKTLEGGATEEEIISAVMNEYDVEREVVEKDVKLFLDALRKAELLDDEG